MRWANVIKSSEALDGNILNQWISDDSYWFNLTKDLKKSTKKTLKLEQSGAVEACWAHNPEGHGWKPLMFISHILFKDTCTSTEMPSLYTAKLRAILLSHQMVQILLLHLPITAIWFQSINFFLPGHNIRPVFQYCWRHLLNYRNQRTSATVATCWCNFLA